MDWHSALRDIALALVPIVCAALALVGKWGIDQLDQRFKSDEFHREVYPILRGIVQDLADGLGVSLKALLASKTISREEAIRQIEHELLAKIREKIPAALRGLADRLFSNGEQWLVAQARRIYDESRDLYLPVGSVKSSPPPAEPETSTSTSGPAKA